MEFAESCGSFASGAKQKKGKQNHEWSKAEGRKAKNGVQSKMIVSDHHEDGNHQTCLTLTSHSAFEQTYYFLLSLACTDLIFVAPSSRCVASAAPPSPVDITLTRSAFSSYSVAFCVKRSIS